jgi:hypothetical protein
MRHAGEPLAGDLAQAHQDVDATAPKGKKVWVAWAGHVRTDSEHLRDVNMQRCDLRQKAGRPMTSESRQRRRAKAGMIVPSLQETIVMASIHKEVSLRASPDDVWDVVRDVGAVHTRFAPGFVVNVEMEDGARIVTFGNGFVAREVIVDVDDAARRLAYSVRSERISHHNASFQVIPEAGGSRLVWIADVLPHEAAESIGGMMEAGIAVAKRTLDTLATQPA